MTVDDLRPCITHRVPINRCAPCWPMFLANLGRACWMKIIEKRKAPWLFVPRASFFKPTIQEQRVFARQVGLLK